MNITEATAQFKSDLPHLRARGVELLDSTVGYLPPAFKSNFKLAMDAQPALTTNVNAGVPAFLTTWIDPSVFEILFSPNMAAVIFGEVRKGSWTDQTAMFPVAEHVVEVSSYGDYATNGHAGVNTNWPQRQSYLFQTVKEYGELELERAGLAKINWVTEIDKAAALGLNKFMNLSYFYGIGGLQNYGLLNDPNLTAALTPAAKANGGVTWFVNGTPNATANEVYNDIVALFTQLVTQTAGLVDKKSKLTLAMSPGSQVALTFTNSFGVNVEDLLKKNFPSLKVETAVQYGVRNTQNPQGVVAGNELQLIADSLEGQDTGFCAFNEKMRAHPIIRDMSSFKQKVTAGTWGAIIRMPVAITQMIGV